LLSTTTRDQVLEFIPLVERGKKDEERKKLQARLAGKKGETRQGV